MKVIVNNEKMLKVKGLINYLIEHNKRFDGIVLVKVWQTSKGQIVEESTYDGIVLEGLIESLKYTFNIVIDKKTNRVLDKVTWEDVKGILLPLFEGIAGKDEKFFKTIWENNYIVFPAIQQTLGKLKEIDERVSESVTWFIGTVLDQMSVIYVALVELICESFEDSPYKADWGKEAVVEREKKVLSLLGVDRDAQTEEASEEGIYNTNPMEDLNKLIGLKSVKEDVSTMVNLLKVRQKRKENSLKVNDMSLHMVFTGNPGTGKTTVARLIAKIYKELGVLSKGNFVEASREDLVAGYVGQTAIKTKKKIEEARGGVLFIDEAYSLNGDGKDFGNEVISTLLKEMEDNRGDLTVIVAGYPDLMEAFLKSNPGLKSRFNKFINFNDYSEEELEQIYELMSKEEGYTISADVKSVLSEKILEVKKAEEKQGDFANARSIRNIFEKSVANQANRLVQEDDFSIGSLQSISVDDIKLVSCDVKKEEKVIGFKKG